MKSPFARTLHLDAQIRTFSNLLVPAFPSPVIAGFFHGGNH
jgi:hypothetical protein